MTVLFCFCFTYSCITYYKFFKSSKLLGGGGKTICLAPPPPGSTLLLAELVHVYSSLYRRIDNYSRGKCSQGRCGNQLLIKTRSNHRQKASAIHRQMETYTNSWVIKLQMEMEKRCRNLLKVRSVAFLRTALYARIMNNEWPWQNA